MKSIRIMGVAVVAALAVMAFVGAATASADSVCKANESTCAAGNILTSVSGATPAGEPAVLTAGSFEVKCASTTTAGSLTSLGVNAGLKGSVTALAFTAGTCTGSCTGATAVNLPYKAEGKASTQAVTVTTGGSGNPGATLTNCLGLGVSCTFQTASAVLHVHGGTPGNLAAEGITLTRSSGLCPKEGSWTAKYVISNATSAFLVAGP